MPNSQEVAQVLKLAARHAKANRAANCTLYDQVLFSLSAASGQLKRQKRYHDALVHHLAWACLKSAGSIKEAWAMLVEVDVPQVETAPQTPVSNTGVTESPATVPLEYFTGGR